MKIQFKKGEYIVLTNYKETKSNMFSNSFIYKQREDWPWLRVERDNIGYTTGAVNVKATDKSSYREATQEEISLYNKEGRPCKISSTFELDNILEKLTKLESLIKPKLLCQENLKKESS